MKKSIAGRKRAFPYLASFLLPFIICILVCIGNGVYPFGENCILHIDMYHQYCPFFTEFLNKLQQGGSLQYSWNLGLGSDFVSLYAYYLASPLNFLILLCPKKFVIEFMTLLILVKIALCGLTFFLFLKYHFHFVGKDGKMHKNQVLPALVFSTAYALSGFVAAYSWDIMWMDCVALFPLIMVGLEKLVREGKPVLYFVTLAVCIFSNYYISIMICIFLVFTFVLLFFTQKQGKGKAFFCFSWYSLLAGGCSLVLLLPEIAALTASGAAGQSFPKKIEWYFNMIGELGRSAAVTTCYTGGDHWPNLYAGSFSLILVFLYLCNRRISWKEKLPRFFMVLFFLVSFSNKQLDYIWHGMHFPQDLPGRQSFLYIFLLLTMGFATVRKWKGILPRHIIIAVLSGMVLMFAAQTYGDENVTEPAAILVTVLFIAVYGILMLLLKIVNRKRRFLVAEFLLFFAVLELGINFAVTGLPVTDRVSYVAKQDAYEKLLAQAKEDNGEEGFYRVEDSGRKTKNDDSLYGYPSATIFSSLMNLDVSHLFQSLYMEGGLNFYCYNGATPLSSSLFSVKYMLSDNPLEESRVRTLIGEEDGNYLYRNRYCLPLGFMMEEDAIKEWGASQADRIGSLNDLAKRLGADGDMLYPAACVQTPGMGDTTIDISEDGYYYASYVECNSDTLTITRSDGWKKQFGKTTHRYLLELGECREGTQIHITNSNGENVEYRVYRVNFNAVQTAYKTLEKQTMELTSMTDRSVQGKIKVERAGRLILSIPADDGWKLYVDGKETKINPFEDALIGVHLTEGEHEIRLLYTSPGLYAGVAGSVVSLLLFAVSMLIRLGRSKKIKQMPYREEKNGEETVKHSGSHVQ
ncbi:MAG: YfhO family protein [Agathobacter sp.]|nr:YfhO family protein [Agathobacter sp.]